MELKKILSTTDKYSDLLKSVGIETMTQFFGYFPREYEDRQHIKMLTGMVDTTTKQSVKGKIIEKKILQLSSKKIGQLVFEDEEGIRGKIVFFRLGYGFNMLQIDQRYIIIGKPQIKKGGIVFAHPEMMRSTDSGYTTSTIESQIPPSPAIITIDHQSERIYPVYPELLGIKPGRFAKKIREHLEEIPEYITDHLPLECRKQFNLTDLATCYRHIHYPPDHHTLQMAKERLFVDTMLRIQVSSLEEKALYTSLHTTLPTDPHREYVKYIVDRLPFQLTTAQKKVIQEMIQDIHSGQPMMRLLQGDVGSGKTIVAAIISYYIKQHSGGQIALLAPLEVLAHQHYLTFAKVLLSLGMRVELLVGSVSADQKSKIKQDLKSGLIDVIVGTHALLQETVDFHNLQLAIIDEQHKFGVKQRSFFKQFGSPHIIQMTATPIPRSMAMAYFGEFDVSIIDEMPLGRKVIKTKIIHHKDWIKLKPWVVDRITKGQGVFVVVPLIEESETLDNVTSAQQEFEEMCGIFGQTSFISPETTTQTINIGLLHGKMKPAEKQKILHDFKCQRIHILVSTTVIEVGVDIPHASVMVIKNAERFGLSQLHQLRGRVGRSDIQSYCFLETHHTSGPTHERLQHMEHISDGFKLSEMDMKLRGTGELLGLRQSGESDLPIELIGNITFVSKVQDIAKWLLHHYPHLDGLPGLQQQLLSTSSTRA